MRLHCLFFIVNGSQKLPAEVYPKKGAKYGLKTWPQELSRKIALKIALQKCPQNDLLNGPKKTNGPRNKLDPRLVLILVQV